MSFLLIPIGTESTTNGATDTQEKKSHDFAGRKVDNETTVSYFDTIRRNEGCVRDTAL